MLHASRPRWRLFCLQLGCVLLALMTRGTAQSPTLTTVAEVRWSDGGWGPYNDENLAGRFTTQIFTLPRLSKVQNYFLRQFDGSVPPKYSRQSAALHIDYPY
jgi:hypothetical protein